MPATALPIATREVYVRSDAVRDKVVAWRRDIHSHPELGFQEVRTSKIVADHMRMLGLEVRTGIAGTGVVGVLRGGKPGPVVALRADMDALPVKEMSGLPFASTVTTTYNGQETPVAHACGHDTHVAMLMGAAEVLAGLRVQIPGTILFVFQPAEEGGPPGREAGGAVEMLQAGALSNPKPGAIFGLHVVPGEPGTVFYRPQGFMAAADQMYITLKGKQTHAAWPWQGIDVISLSSAIVSELNTLAARTVDVTATPTVLSVASINGGVRWNIIPEEVKMSGTLRTFDPKQRIEMQKKVTTTVNNLAASYGAKAEVRFAASGAVTWNDPKLSSWIAAPLVEAAGADRVDGARRPTMVSEDFSYFQEQIPGVFYHLGGTPKGTDPATAAPNHSPYFMVDESILTLGVRTHALTALRWLEANAAPAATAAPAAP
ncbi:MAG: amidohydrolase [Alphaproteobacteria bacterium]|nr:amidohydrolase [Alphaproteobacteria bacterium]